MMKEILCALLLSISANTDLFAQPDPGDDECAECQVCFETEDLRQVCDCLHHICPTCIEGLANHRPSHTTSIPCPNCRRPWLATAINELLAPIIAQRERIRDEAIQSETLHHRADLRDDAWVETLTRRSNSGDIAALFMLVALDLRNAY